MTIIHYIGSGFLLFVILYIIVDLFEKKKLSLQDVMSRVLVICILFMALLRTK